MKKNYFSSLLIAMSFLLLLASVSCQGKKKSDPLTLKIGAMSSLDYIPYVIAERVGIYDSLGLNLEIVKFFSANDRDAALRGGQLDGTVTDFTGAAIQHAGGMDLALVLQHDGFFEMMALPGLQTIEELKGKRVGVSRNTVIEYATDRILAHYGLEENAVEKPEVNKIPLRLEMMLASELEASLFPDPFISIAKSQGFNSLASTKDLGIHVVGTVLTREAMNEKADAIHLLIKGYNLAIRYMMEHPREEWVYILSEDAMMPTDLAMTVSLPDYTLAQAPFRGEIEATIKWLKERNLVPNDYTGEGLVDDSFIPSEK